MTVYLLPDEPCFPPAEEADPDGLLAIGGDLSPARLLNAYASGIFPWFLENGEVYWFSPEPRMVIFPERFRLSASLQRVVKSGKFTIRFDQDFEDVIRACAEAPRPGQDGTWISPEFIRAYSKLHRMGYAHSVAAYADGILAGGLYGIALGRAFFGESMFYKQRDASKIALAALVQQSLESGCHFIDCQTESDHLRRLGAESVSRAEYLLLLEKALGINRSQASCEGPSE